MHDLIFDSAKQRNAAAKNFQHRVNDNTEEGIKARMFMRRVTKDKKYNERNFQRSDKKITKTQFKKDWIAASRKQEAVLKEEWHKIVKRQKERRKKLPRGKKSQIKIPKWKQFRHANRERDSEIGSLITSP